jgi:hypothetical protein
MHEYIYIYTRARASVHSVDMGMGVSNKTDFREISCEGGEYSFMVLIQNCAVCVLCYSSSSSSMALQSSMDFRLLNGFLPVGSVFDLSNL